MKVPGTVVDEASTEDSPRHPRQERQQKKKEKKTTEKMKVVPTNPSTATLTSPCGCDTLVAFPPATARPGLVVFGKNSDRPEGEGQTLQRYPAATYEAGAMLSCTYLDIPQVIHTYAVLISQIDWMWGCEHGANEHGVVIGNEAVWTNVPDEVEKPSLLGMDLVRLGLERGATAKEARTVITDLLKEHGQGGACAENDPSFTYHNSFLIADSTEAWILETAGCHWVAEQVTEGVRNISNGLTIRTEFEMSSDGIREYAKEQKLWDGKEPFDFARSFSAGGVDTSPYSRQGCGTKLLKERAASKTMDRHAMMEILRDHESGICMHGGFETTASMVTELNGADGTTQHWTTGPHPCKSEYKVQCIAVTTKKE